MIKSRILLLPICLHKGLSQAICARRKTRGCGQFNYIIIIRRILLFTSWPSLSLSSSSFVGACAQFLWDSYSNEHLVPIQLICMAHRNSICICTALHSTLHWDSQGIQGETEQQQHISAAAAVQNRSGRSVRHNPYLNGEDDDAADVRCYSAQNREFHVREEHAAVMVGLWWWSLQLWSSP